MRTLFGMLCFFGVPSAAIIGFIFSYIKFKSYPAEHTEDKKKWKTIMIVTGVISLVFISLIIFIIALLSLAIANM